MSPRLSRREATLARIIEVATDLVAEGGLAQLSMQGLAKSLGYTPGALYRYYRSKDEILAGIATRVIQQYVDQAAQTHRALDGTGPLCEIVGALMTYRAVAEAMPNRFGLLSLMMAEPRMLVPQDSDAHPII